MTEAELALRSGVSLERLRRLVEVGVVQPSGADRFRPIDVQRIRIVEAFVDSGLAVEDLGRLVADGHVTFPNLEAVFGEPISVSDTRFAEFAAEFDLHPDLLRRVYTQLNLAQPDDDDRLRADDLEFLANSFSCSMRATSASVTTFSSGLPAFAAMESGGWSSR
jgi:DNA-binding transcriptional MerR regulator